MFFYTSDEDDPLITRTKEIADNVIPGANSTLAKGLYLLGTYLYNEDYLAKSEQMLNNIFPQLSEQPAYYANWAMLLNWFTHKPYEVAIVGENFEALRAQLNDHFLPNAFLLGGKNEGKLELLEKQTGGRRNLHLRLPGQSLQISGSGGTRSYLSLWNKTFLPKTRPGERKKNL